MKKILYYYIFFILISCKSELDIVYYKLTINSEPENAGVVNPDSKVYESGEQASIYATAKDGYVFERWSGDISSVKNPESVLMDDDKNITAIFGIKPEKSFDFSQSEGLMISKAKTSMPNGSSNSNYNAQLINFNGKIENLNIPGSKSIDFEIVRAFDINEKYLLILGSLTVEYVGDVDGDGISGDILKYSNILIDKETGDFYDAGQGNFPIYYEPGGSPWINVGFQSDSQDNIYYRNQENIGNNVYQVIDKLSFNVDQNGYDLIANREKLNTLVGDHKFWYVVGDDGILWKGGMEDPIGFRNNQGKNYNLNDGITGDDPLIFENQSTNDFNRHVTFMLQRNNKKLLVFKAMFKGYPTYPERNKIRYGILEISEQSGQINKRLIKEFNYAAEVDISQMTQREIDGLQPIIFEGYDQSPALFVRKINDNETSHIIVNSNSGDKGTFFTKIVENNSTDDISIDGVFTSLLTENQFFSAFQYDRYSALNDFALFVAGNNIVKINFNTLSAENLIENSGYAFYKLASVSDKEFLFYGLSYENSKITLGKFNENGQIEIIEQFDNEIDVLKLFRIGN